METSTITLGGIAHQVGPIPLGRLKRLMPALTAFSSAVATMGAGDFSEADMDAGIAAIAAGLNKPVAEVEQMTGVTVIELVEAVNVLAMVAGLVPKQGSSMGEALPVVTPATDLTQSTG